MRSQRKNKNLARIVFVVFFVILLSISYNLLSARNRIMDLDFSDISYIEIIRDNNQVMKTINDKSQIRKIVKSLNRSRGKRTGKDPSMENLNHINVFKKSGKKIEVVKMGYILRVDEKWYYLNKRSTDSIDKIFEIAN